MHSIISFYSFCFLTLAIADVSAFSKHQIRFGVDDLQVGRQPKGRQTNGNDEGICTKDMCEYTFVVQHHYTMVYYGDDDDAYMVKWNGTCFKVLNTSNHVENGLPIKPIIGSCVAESDINQVDGRKKPVITINNKYPGPKIEVMKGAQVVVNVFNDMQMEGISFHWHGMFMRNTPWMDGVAYVTQCPIEPKQNFTYRFKAEPAGTHWYHSHLFNQKFAGSFGLLIIHKTQPPLPSIPIVLNDFFGLSNVGISLDFGYPGTGGIGEIQSGLTERIYSQDGIQISGFDYDSAIINGKGRGPGQPSDLPLEVFIVQRGNQYRARLVNAGGEFAFIISIDNHLLKVVASDGGELQPIEVEYLIIYPGETTDFEFTADQTLDYYWLRANTIAATIGRFTNRTAEVKGTKAIISYTSSVSPSLTTPNTSDHNCTQTKRCRVFNCPFQGYREDQNRVCVGFGDAKGVDTKRDTYGLDTPDHEVIELFLNVAFLNGPSINAKKFSSPVVPLFQNNRNSINPCPKSMCTQENPECYCTHLEQLPFNRTIQLVINGYDLKNGSGQSIYHAHHPMHLHGHDFAVLAMGYAQYDKMTGYYTGHNPDIKCDAEICAEQSWNNTPILNKVDPPVKDTITVPARGYAVIRFRSDNPGHWIFHCHLINHLAAGMAMVFEEVPERAPGLPPDFPTCGAFQFTSEQYEHYVSGRWRTENTVGLSPYMMGSPLLIITTVFIQTAM